MYSTPTLSLETEAEIENFTRSTVYSTPTLSLETEAEIENSTRSSVFYSYTESRDGGRDRELY